METSVIFRTYQTVLICVTLWIQTYARTLPNLEHHGSKSNCVTMFSFHVQKCLDRVLFIRNKMERSSITKENSDVLYYTIYKQYYCKQYEDTLQCIHNSLSRCKTDKTTITVQDKLSQPWVLATNKLCDINVKPDASADRTIPHSGSDGLNPHTLADSNIKQTVKDIDNKDTKESSVDKHISDIKDNAIENRNIPTLNKDLINDSVNKVETKSDWHKGVIINNKEITKTEVPNNNAKMSGTSTDKDLTNIDSSTENSKSGKTDGISRHKLIGKKLPHDTIKFSRKIDTNKSRSKTLVFNRNNIESDNYVKSFQISVNKDSDHKTSTDSAALLNVDG